MEHKIAKIIKHVQGQNINEQATEMIVKSFDFLQNIAPFQDSKTKEIVLNDSIKSAQNYSLRPLSVEMLTVLILESWICRQPEKISLIQNHFSDNIYQIAKAYCLLFEKLNNQKIHDRNLFWHSLNTTLLLAESQSNHKTIIASLIKHLPEFSDFSLHHVEKNFDEETAQIINNANSLKELNSQMNLKNARLLQQMFLAMAKDLRPVLIKICSSIDLLKNIEQINATSRQPLALEAMQIYAPIADILGAWRLKWQLEDYSFKFLNPLEYTKIEKKFNVDEKKNRDKYIEKTKKIIYKETQKYNIRCVIDGRFKHFYSIYKKMLEKRKTFNEIYDVFALRIIVDSIDDCYRMLGIIHQLWPPKPRRIKDYIARPKTNNYRGLHTTVFGLNQRMTEFQIRTKEMDEVAKFGVAAHWSYKNDEEKAPRWIKNLLAEKTKTKDNDELLETINTEILIDKIFVFTPKGDIISLPKGATPVDFAYEIHTNLGRRAISAIVNENPVDLNYKLQNEDLVEIIIDPNKKLPDSQWLDFVISNQAKKNIKLQINSSLSESE